MRVTAAILISGWTIEAFAVSASSQVYKKYDGQHMTNLLMRFMNLVDVFCFHFHIQSVVNTFIFRDDHQFMSVVDIIICQ